MKPKSFTTRIGHSNKKWLGDVLDLSHQKDNNGIDLTDDSIGVEIKSRYTAHSHRFPVHYYQIDQFKKENQGKELFWAFMLYGLKSPPKLIKRNIDDAITNRTVWFYEWNWVKRFPVHNVKTGPYIYVSESSFDVKNHFRYTKGDGALYVPRNSTLEMRLK